LAIGESEIFGNSYGYARFCITLVIVAVQHTAKGVGLDYINYHGVSLELIYLSEYLLAVVELVCVGH
jgi:hypothetical protein